MLKTGPKPSPVGARNKRLGGGGGGDGGGFSGEDENDDEEEEEEGGGDGKVTRVDPLRALLLHPSGAAGSSGVRPRTPSLLTSTAPICRP